MKTINFAVSEHNSRVYSLIFLGDNMKFKKYATKTLMIVIGSIISAYGITLAIGAGFGRGSYEAVTFSLAEKNGWKIKIVRMVLDIIMVIIGVLLGGKFGICTIATVLLSGPIIQATVSTVKKSKI